MIAALASAVAMLAVAVATWRDPNPPPVALHFGDPYAQGGVGYTVYGPTACDIYLTPAWASLNPTLRQAVVTHEVWHCEAGLFHPICQCVAENPALFPAVDPARPYIAPWRGYPRAPWRRIALMEVSRD